MSWTLTCNGVTKTLAEWGVKMDFNSDAGNKQKRSVALTTTEAFDVAASNWSYLQPVIIRNDSAIWFQGYFDSPQRIADGGRENLVYRAHNVWWLLEQHKFIQTRNEFNGWTVPDDPRTPPTFKRVFMPEIFLGQKADNSRQTNGEQITEVLNWVNECFNPTRRGAVGGIDAAQDVLQIGTIDVAVNIPITRVSGVYCSEAIVNLLRWCPDAVVRVDESTTPPTIHVWSESSQPVINIALSATQEGELKAQRQDALELTGVMIYYHAVDTYNGVGWPRTTVDKYPPETTEYTPLVEKHYVELAGGNASLVQATVLVAPAAACQSAVAAERVDWWKANGAHGGAHNVSLKDARIDPDTITVGGATITDKDDNPISLDDYPNEFLKGHLAGWMGVSFIEVTVKAEVSFYRYDDADHTVLGLRLQKKVMQCTIKLTDAVSKTYSNFTRSEFAEEIPTGVAQLVYESLVTPRFAGDISLTGDQIRTDIYVGTRLTLTGPNNTFTGCVVQSIGEQPCFGRVKVGFGPNARLDAPALIELARATRFRVAFGLCDRAGGTGSSGTQVTLGEETPGKDTVQGENNLTYQSVNNYSDDPSEGDPEPAPTAQIQLDPAAFESLAGSYIPTKADRIMKPREVRACDEDGTEGFMVVMAGPFYIKP